MREHAIGGRAAQGQRRGAGAGLVGRWSPRRCPPNRTLRLPPHPALHEHMEWVSCPLVQLALEVKYPLPGHRRLGKRRARVHRRPPSVQSCCVLTGPLRPADGSPAPPVARDCHDYYGSSATPRRQQRTVRLPQTHQPGFGGHRRDASHVHSYTGRQGRRPAVPRGHRRAPPQPGARPRPPERVPDKQDDPQRERGPSIPTAHSRQFRGW